MQVSLVLFLLLGICLLAGGALYLSIDEFMPYHAEAVQSPWSDLDENYRGLILGLIKALGGGGFVAGFATVYMAVALFRDPSRPFKVLLPAVSTGYSAFLCYATYTVFTTTPANPPLLLTVSYVLVGLIATGLLAASARHRTTLQR